MKDFIENIKDRAREDPKRIVFPESTEERTLKAIEKVLEEGTAPPASGVIIFAWGSLRKQSEKADQIWPFFRKVR